jgi:hypothetical protein
MYKLITLSALSLVSLLGLHGLVEAGESPNQNGNTAQVNSTNLGNRSKSGDETGHSQRVQEGATSARNGPQLHDKYHPRFQGTKNANRRNYPSR